MRFEDVRSDALVPNQAALELEYEFHLLSAAKRGVGTKLPLVELENLDPAAIEACKHLQALASRVARGNINEEVKGVLNQLAALDEEYIVFVHFFRLKTGPGRSWDPNTGAITSAVASTLMQSALVSCKTQKVIWTGEQFLRKALKPTSPEFEKSLVLLYQDLDIK